MGSQQFSCCCLRRLFLFHLFSLHQFLFQLSTFLFLNALLDFQFKLFLLGPDLLQLGLPLSLQVWILKQQFDHKSTRGHFK